jgi:hypothetical protein
MNSNELVGLLFQCSRLSFHLKRGGVRFECRPAHRLYRLMFFIVFVNLYRQILVEYLKLDLKTFPLKPVTSRIELFVI